MKYMYAIIMALLSFIISSCSSENMEYVPFQSSNNGSWGMIKTNGEVLFDSEFKNEPTIPSDGLFSVQNKDGLWEIYTLDSKPKKIGSEYLYVSPFADGLAVAVKRNEPIKIINKEGKVVISLDKIGSQKIISATAFVNGLSVVQTLDGFGIVDKTGKEVLRPKYMFLTLCTDGTIVGIDNKYRDLEITDAKLSIMNNSGQVLSTISMAKYEDASEKWFVGGKLAIKATADQDMWGFINTKGETVIKPTEKNSQITDYTEKYFIYYDGEGYGLKDFTGENIIRAKYDDLVFANEDGSLLWAASNKESGMRWTLINNKDEKISNEDYESYTKFFGKYAFVKSSGNYYSIIDNNGKDVKLTTDIFALSSNRGATIVYSDLQPTEEEIRKLVDAELSNLPSLEDNSTEETGHNYILYKGNIDEYPITMYLDLSDENNVTGYYYYDQKKSNGKLLLSGTYEHFELTLFEKNEDGEQTGHFMGGADGKCFQGTFYLPNGQTMPFSICEE